MIEDADAIGDRVTAFITDNPAVFSPGAVETMDYIVEVLNELGLRATLRIVHDGFGKYFGAIDAGKAQAYLSAWGSVYPSAHDFIDPQFRCGAPFNASGLCSETLDAAIDEAQRLQATDPAAANGAWIEIEHRLVEDAIWVPLTNPVSAYSFSARTENIQVNPQWGILLSRLWVE